MGFRQLTGHEQARFSTRLDVILENPDIVTAVLATNDGGQLAAPSRNSGINTMHVADACAKIAAVGRQLAGLSEDSPRGVSVCDLAGSPMVVVPLGPAILVVLGRQGTNMGMVASTARDAARHLSDAIVTVVEREEPAVEKAPGGESQASEARQGFVFDAEGLTARVLGDLANRSDPDPVGNEA